MQLVSAHVIVGGKLLALGQKRKSFGSSGVVVGTSSYVRGSIQMMWSMFPPITKTHTIARYS